MKALILAAGKGTRMMPLTKHKPKCLIEVNGKPFLHYVLESLDKAGIEDIYMVVGEKMSMVEEFVEEFSDDVKLIIQEERLGTGHAVLQAKEHIDDNFLILMADNLYSPEDILKMMKYDEFTYVAGYPSDHPQDYGVLIPKNGFLKEIIEKPKKPPSNLVNVGLYKATPEIFNYLEKVEKSPRGEYELTDAITMLCDQDKVKHIKLDKYWIDMSIKEQLPEISKKVKELGL